MAAEELALPSRNLQSCQRRGGIQIEKPNIYSTVASPLVEMAVSSPVLFMLTRSQDREAPVTYLMQSSLYFTRIQSLR